jgi:hypothetical protein
MKTAGFVAGIVPGWGVGIAFALAFITTFGFAAGCDPAKVQHPPGTTPARTDAGGAGGAPAPGPGKDGGASAPDASGTAPTGDAGGGTGGGQPAAFTERPCNFRTMPARPVRCGVVTVPEARGGVRRRPWSWRW